MDFLKFIAIAIVVLIGGYLGLQWAEQSLEKHNFGSYEFIVRQDNIYWYTHATTIDSNKCVNFRSNYNTDVKWCEKYQVETNYWHIGSPTLKTIWYGY